MEIHRCQWIFTLSGIPFISIELYSSSCISMYLHQPLLAPTDLHGRPGRPHGLFIYAFVESPRSLPGDFMYGHQHPWTSMDLHGCPSIYITLHAPRWMYISLHGDSMETPRKRTWREHGIYLDIHESSWISMNLRGSPWRTINPRGCPWMAVNVDVSSFISVVLHAPLLVFIFIHLRGRPCVS